MGFANRNWDKQNKYDVDFVGYTRMPLEFGGKLCRIGIFVKLMPDKKTQYLSLKFLDMESVLEHRITEKTDRLIRAMIETGDIFELPGVKEKYGDSNGEIDEVYIEGFDDVNNEF